MAQVRWSLTAGKDLQDIEDFIARDSILHAITFVDPSRICRHTC
jgi:plasmid stabilization system protein ParE